MITNRDAQERRYLVFYERYLDGHDFKGRQHRDVRAVVVFQDIDQLELPHGYNPDQIGEDDVARIVSVVDVTPLDTMPFVYIDEVDYTFDIAGAMILVEHR